MTEETKSQSDEIFETLWADIEFREYVGNNNIPLEFIINLVDKVSELANEGFKLKLDKINNSAMESILNWQKENEQLKQSKNALVIQLEQDISELNVQIEKMKPYCKELCKNYQRTGFMGNDCQNGVCKKCDKWEFIDDNFSKHISINSDNWYSIKYNSRNYK